MKDIKKNPSGGCYIIDLINKGASKRADFAKYTRKSDSTVRIRLNHLMEIGLLAANGAKNDPGRVYSAIIK